MQDANQKLTYAQMMKRERQAKAEAEIEELGENKRKHWLAYLFCTSVYRYGLVGSYLTFKNNLNRSESYTRGK